MVQLGEKVSLKPEVIGDPKEEPSPLAPAKAPEVIGDPKEEPSPIDPVKALQAAAKSGDALGVRELLRSKVHVDARYNGLTALHWAAVFNRVDVVRTLVYEGADIYVRTDDENAVTPVGLAHLEENEEVVRVICDMPAKKRPFRRRYLGPCLILAILAIFFIFGLHLLGADWERDGEVLAPKDEVETWEVALVCVFVGITVLSLFLVNALDPGAVEREEVAYAHRLRSGPADSLAILNEEHFLAVVAPGAAPESFRWCRSCELWRPRGVSHCSECRRCFWRFDHHCLAVGTCVAARNHRFFASLLLSASAAWASGIILIIRHLEQWDLLSDLGRGVEPAWRWYLAVVYLAVGVLGTSLLSLWSIFHSFSLIFHYNTKMLMRPVHRTPKQRFNSRQELAMLFFMPFKWRARGPPRPLRPKCLDPGSESDTSGKVGLTETI